MCTHTHTHMHAHLMHAYMQTYGYMWVCARASTDTCVCMHVCDLHTPTCAGNENATFLESNKYESGKLRVYPKHLICLCCDFPLDTGTSPNSLTRDPHSCGSLVSGLAIQHTHTHCPYGTINPHTKNLHNIYIYIHIYTHTCICIYIHVYIYIYI